MGLFLLIGIVLSIGIVGYCIVYMIDKIQSDRYYERQHNTKAQRALRQINKSRTGTTTNMCKEIKKED